MNVVENLKKYDSGIQVNWLSKRTFRWEVEVMEQPSHYNINTLLETEENEDIINLNFIESSTLLSGLFRQNPSQFVEEKSDLQKCKTASKRGDFYFF